MKKKDTMHVQEEEKKIHSYLNNFCFSTIFFVDYIPHL